MDLNNVFKYIAINEFLKHVKRLEKGGDFTYLKRNLKYVNEEGLG